jgi:hypothetical protein
VPLGGSLRASRAALLARPLGPLAAVDLADGRGLMVEDLGAGWVACQLVAAPPALVAPAAPDGAAARVAAPVRRRRLGTALVLAGALGAAVVALASGFSGAPSRAVAGPIERPGVSRPPAPAPVHAAARGGRAAPAVRAKPPPSPPSSPPVPPPAPVAPAVAALPPSPPPAPPPLPELPSVPAL